MFLDWEKAFDKILHPQLAEALKRIGLPESICHIIKDLYENPTFRAKVDGKTSKLKKQLCGIRQGCTLSPYLFLIVMTVLFHDVKQQTDKSTKNSRPMNFVFY